jgi:hypothetical protein
MFPPTSAANILMPNDYGMVVSMRYIALSYVDRTYFPRDERAQQQVVSNYGPDRLGGTYPGMAPSNPMASQSPNAGSPKIIGIQNDSMNWPGYGGSLGDTGSWDASHSPNPFYWVYIHSGHPMFLDAMMEFCNSQTLYTGAMNLNADARAVTLGGKNYCFAFTTGVQARGYGHQFKTSWQTEWSIPSNHPAKPYFSARMDDTANQFMNWVKATQSATAQQVGWFPTAYNTFAGSTAQIVEQWMTGYFMDHIAQVCLINTRPGFADILNYMAKFWLALFDSDQNGSEKTLDGQYILVGTGVNSTSGNTFAPADSEFILDPQIRQAAPLGATNIMRTTWPPPGNNFLHGLPQQQSPNAYVYWTAPIPANSYLASNRASLVVAELAGFAAYAKVRQRVDALLQSSGVPIQFIAPTSQINWGNRNGLMYAFAPF